MNDDVAASEAAPEPRDGGDIELLALIDRLARLLERSDLAELEVEAGGTGLILRKPIALAPVAIAAPAAAVTTAVPASGESSAQGEPSTAGRDPSATATPSVKAPLTGIFYASPAPGTAPYVQVGGEVAIGQVIGLIEAMKLFNEIQAETDGVVREIVVENAEPVEYGQLLFLLEPA